MKRDDSATFFRTSIWYQFVDLREVEVPEEKCVAGVLLFVKRDGERDRLCDDI